MLILAKLNRRMKRLAARLHAEIEEVARNTAESAIDYSVYFNDPLGYIRDVLKVTLTPGQVECVEALMSPPRKVLVSSGHSVGKTMLAAALVNWWYDTRTPGICLTTAPTDRQVKDLLWKEVRILRDRAGLPLTFAGPKIPRLELTPDHFAHGFTAREATKFQGHHGPNGVFVLFDEAEGVDAHFWQAAKTMLDDNSYWLCTYNPTTVGSAAHLKEQEADALGTFRRVTLSCLDHPNILAQEAGLPAPIPGAITLGQLESMLLEDSRLLTDAEPSHPGDVTLAGKRYRPGPIAEARCLGRRPSQGVNGVWNEDLWKRVLATRLDITAEWPVAIGCDVARYGDDHTAIFVRKGYCILHVETHTKQNTAYVAKRCRELAHHFRDSHNEERRIPCLIDEGGIGGGVIDQSDGYLFVPVNAACKPRNQARYVNVRAELWFTSRELPQRGLLDLSRVPQAYLSRLKHELMIATYTIRPTDGKLQIVSKDDMKATLKRSPDLADALCLVLYPPGVNR